MGWRLNCVTRLTGSVDGCWKPDDYRADAPRRRAISALKNTIVPMLRVACRSGRSASGLAFAVRRRLVTQSVTNGIPTLERAER